MDDTVVSPGNKMGDSASESDSSSLDGGAMLPPSTVSRDQLQKRIESLQQQNRVLKVELDTYKLRTKALQEENRALRQASVSIQAKAEQEEEYISNTLLKKIQALKKEKETLAHHYEREEECLTNDLSRKLNQLRQEKCRLELTLEQEQECLVNKLMRKIEKLEAETLAKQTNLERLRREKVELENTLEQEQEALVNRLWKRMDKLEAEKRSLQIRLDQPVSDPASPSNGDTASNLSSHIQTLRSEVVKLRNQLAVSQNENKEKMHRFALEEKYIRDENLRLQRKLQQEVERREALCRHLSESESSLEMEEERQFNEAMSARSRSVSSPGGSRPLSPYASPLLPNAAGLPMSRPNLHFNSQTRRATSERFVKPAVPGAALLCRTAPLEPPVAPHAAAPQMYPAHGAHAAHVAHAAHPAHVTLAAQAAPPSPAIAQPASPMDTSSKD
ncbi:coiled-coil domain-containing protein 6 isoform X2 [Battus philenor]|uniref:coiled-coil domain-containing protein 6 isoform X2 n=1 Tax=Battus philenor TaxID=42288 RepID=UPI0035D11CC1